MIGQRLKQLRRRLNKMTQSEFAKPLEIPYTAISKYETDQINPSSEILSKIGKIYKVNLNWLLTGEGEIFLSQDSIPREIIEIIYNLESNYQEDIFKYIEERRKLSTFDKQLDR
jgi:transcriptional regulator with XRE-family HTH domain